jgi:hypothetical protein
MKRTLGPISLDRRLFFLLVRFGLTAIVFFGVCTGTFLAFGAFLRVETIHFRVLSMPLFPFIFDFHNEQIEYQHSLLNALLNTYINKRKLREQSS